MPRRPTSESEQGGPLPRELTDLPRPKEISELSLEEAQGRLADEQDWKARTEQEIRETEDKIAELERRASQVAARLRRNVDTILKPRLEVYNDRIAKLEARLAEFG